VESLIIRCACDSCQIAGLPHGCSNGDGTLGLDTPAAGRGRLSFSVATQAVSTSGDICSDRRVFILYYFWAEARKSRALEVEKH